MPAPNAVLADIRPKQAKATLPERAQRPSGSLVEAAMNAARMAPKQLADAMGVSHSFLLRGFKDQEHISWQRIHRVTDRRFRQALLAEQAEDITGVIVRTVIEFDAQKVG